MTHVQAPVNPGTLDALLQDEEPESVSLADKFAVAWFPAGEYEQAVQLWSELAESDLVAGPHGPLPHPLYCRAMQHKLIDFAEAGFAQMVVAYIYTWKAIT
ncbi:hypothetical protein MXEN_04193 [Mycobacterium xenopi RIVM700367]|uniref:hypothetical protein n=1 Tax=Mycobacterium xenopi TaxID=1789 RepID=UPI00025AD635|nr:hypothetical protein [Mycobacterium xenopi]EID16289.1 hypothetical protein MXEN_04193 [Mycobacterium xenopi RIVM700367]